MTGFVTTVRDTVSKQIEENTDWDLFGQNVASFLYNTGLSVGDSALQVGLLGPWATYLMGASAASQQAVNVLERGGSNSQAFWGGLAALAPIRYVAHGPSSATWEALSPMDMPVL